MPTVPPSFDHLVAPSAPRRIGSCETTQSCIFLQAFTRIYCCFAVVVVVVVVFIAVVDLCIHDVGVTL